MRWLWNAAYGPRPAWWNLPALLIWALFGNAEDGPYGHFAKDAKSERDWAVAWRWWTRNPLHNLWFHVLAVPRLWSVALIGTPDEYPCFWPKGRGVLLSLNTLPLLSFRLGGWEGYIGFRPSPRKDGAKLGVFGMAFRKSHK